MKAICISNECRLKKLVESSCYNFILCSTLKHPLKAAVIIQTLVGESTLQCWHVVINMMVK